MTPEECKHHFPVSWQQISLVAFGGVLLAAAAFWTWLAVQLHLQPGSPAPRGIVYLVVSAVDFLGAGAAFVAAGALRSKWIAIAGASLLVLRYPVFQWMLRRSETQT
jgi:hypothetical protein